MYEAPSSIIHHSSTTLPATNQPSGIDPPKGLRMFGREDPLHHRGPGNSSSLQAETKAARISTLVLVCPWTLQDLLLGQKKNIPHACLPVHRHLSYVYCMSVWNMSWYVNVFLVQSHNNIDITCAVISYIYHTCIYIYVYVYTYVCQCIYICVYHVQ